MGPGCFVYQYAMLTWWWGGKVGSARRRRRQVVLSRGAGRTLQQLRGGAGGGDGGGGFARAPHPPNPPIHRFMYPPPDARGAQLRYIHVHTRGLFARRPIIFVCFDGRPITFVCFDGRPITFVHSIDVRGAQTEVYNTRALHGHTLVVRDEPRRVKTVYSCVVG